MSVLARGWYPQVLADPVVIARVADTAAAAEVRPRSFPNPTPHAPPHPLLAPPAWLFMPRCRLPPAMELR